MSTTPRPLKLFLTSAALLGVLAAFQNCSEGFKAEVQGEYSSSSVPAPGPNPLPGGPPPAPQPPAPPANNLRNQWLTMSTSGAPQARNGHSAVWTGTKMIVWGGATRVNNLTTYLASGGLYDPATNTWEPMSTAGAPSPRAGHTAIWTGTRMIVFGGRNIAPPNVFSLNDGGIYDPATNTWQPLSTVGAPSGRAFHTSIWTGTRMIVFGGAGYSSAGADVPYGDGATYDPATNTWQPIASIPTARNNHTAVWTGNRMLVFGGQAGATYYNDLLSYDPATNTWLNLPPATALQGRTYHSAAWTGSKLVIWGGYRAPNSLNDGAVFDPVTNTWQAITMTGAPAARYVHGTVWTGARMIVFGGAATTNQVTNFNDGGIYDPVANTWQPLSTTGAPSARVFFSTVWTGTRMIVFGGSNTSVSPAVFLGDGGVLE